MKCPYCDAEKLDVVPEFVFAEDVIIITECENCHAGWLTIASKDCDNLEKLGVMIGDMMGMEE
jgi:transcriptional regulator NrdR family protein